MNKRNNQTALLLVFAITFFAGGCAKKEESSWHPPKESPPPQPTAQELATRSAADAGESEAPTTNNPIAADNQPKDVRSPQQQESGGELKLIVEGRPGGGANTPEGLLVESGPVMCLVEDGTKIQQYQIWNQRRESINGLEVTIELYDDKGNRVGTVSKQCGRCEPGWCWAFTIEPAKEVAATKVVKLLIQ